MNKTSTPLVVDLDGTFLKTDVLWEAVLATFKKHPGRLAASPFSLFKGRAAFKRHLTDQTVLDTEHFPVADEILDLIKKRRDAGDKIILATGSTLKTAQAIQRLYPVFDEVIATEGSVNLTGRQKSGELEKRFGKGGFDYIGNDLADLRVWSRCRTAYIYNSHWITRFLLRVMHPDIVAIEQAPRSTLGTLIRAIRVHQWTKNLLLVVPFLAAHQPFSPDNIVLLLKGFFAFNFTASATYLLNDMLDLEHDRRHPTKQNRPVASGRLPIPSALGLVAVFLSVTILLIQGTPRGFVALLIGYFALTCAYSLMLKRQVLLDVITLAVLYVWRLVAGGALMSIALSRWFAVFSIFFFFSLALVKRCSELTRLKERGEQDTHGRGYRIADLTLVSQFGTASGFLSALVYCLYIASPEISNLYGRAGWLWLGLPLLLFWICRLWLLAGRGEVHEDPVIFTLKDPMSYAVGAAMLVIIYAAV